MHVNDRNTALLVYSNSAFHVLVQECAPIAALRVSQEPPNAFDPAIYALRQGFVARVIREPVGPWLPGATIVAAYGGQYNDPNDPQESEVVDALMNYWTQLALGECPPCSAVVGDSRGLPGKP